MIQQYDNSYKRFYVTSQGEKRKNAIFAPGIDRFILIDEYDFWTTLQIAEILSSKLPTVAYILQPNPPDINNTNCINYTIYNKTTQNLGTSPIVGGRQHPLLKVLNDIDSIVDVGIPED